MPGAPDTPRLSVIMPTFDNVAVLRRSVAAWQERGGADVEVIVVEDGCRDATAAYLDEVEAGAWGSRQLRRLHQEDAHELRCTNAGFAAARGAFMMAWQDDMFLRAT